MEPVEAAGVLVGGLRGGPGVGRGDAELLDASRGGEGQDGGDEFVPRAEGEEHFRGEVAAGLHVEGERRYHPAAGERGGGAAEEGVALGDGEAGAVGPVVGPRVEVDRCRGGPQVAVPAREEGGGGGLLGRGEVEDAEQQVVRQV